MLPFLRRFCGWLRLFPVVLCLFLASVGCQTGGEVGSGSAGAEGGADEAAGLSAALRAELVRLHRALKEPAADADPVARYRHLMRLGRLYTSLGRSGAAEDAFRRALEVREERWGFDDPGAAPVLSHLALEISNQSRFEEADILFKRAEQTITNSAGPVSPLDRPRLLSYQAIDQANRGRYEEALALAEEATLLRRDVLKAGATRARAAGQEPIAVLGNELADMAHGLFIEAAIRLRMGESEASEARARLARTIVVSFERVPEHWLAAIDELLALIELSRDDLTDAELRLRNAVLARRRALGETRPAALSYLALGQVLQLDGRPQEALDSMRQGTQIIRRELAEVQGIDPRRLLAFLAAAEAAARNQPERSQALYRETFEIAQLSREDLTARTIARTAARLSAGDNRIAALIRRAQEAARLRDQLRLDLGREVALPPGKRNKKRIDELQVLFDEASALADKLKAELESTFPAYTKLIASRPVSIEELTPVLGEDEALIYYTLGDRESYVFLVRGDGTVRLAPLDMPRHQINEAVSDLRQAFEVVGGNIRPYDLFAAHRLYEKLLGPVADGLAGVDHLILVPAGTLLSLPFGILVTEQPQLLGEEGYQQASWLGQQMAMSVLPSVRAFADLRGLIVPSQAPRPFLGFGNPTFTGRGGATSAGAEDTDAALAQCRLDAPIEAASLRALAPLPGTATELRRIAAQLGAGGNTVRLGSAVTETAIRRADLDRYRILYFATHGLLRGELPCQTEPALALSPPARTAASRNSDGLLDASEIAGLSLDADLVVLSACNTGASGGRFGGNALDGLARAFFYAGARSLLVSHWKIDSQATTLLMTETFKRFGPQSRRAAAEALRQAQTSVLNRPNTAHPFFWGAFTLVGDGG